jgi:CDP-diglyceride synthetase
VKQLNEKNEDAAKKAKNEMQIPSLKQLEDWYVITDLDNVRDIVESQFFVNKTLVLTCLSMLLESFAHFFITFQLSLIYIFYFLEPHLVVIFINFTAWSDAGGIFGGKFFGKDSFASSISPSKTIQGIYGALCLPVFVGLIYYTIGQLSDGYLALKMPFIDYVWLSFVTGLLAILGDLCESFLKRCSNVKDSGHILQDHGGILDRADSMLLNAPLWYWYSREYLHLRSQKNYNFNNIHIIGFFM